MHFYHQTIYPFTVMGAAVFLLAAPVAAQTWIGADNTNWTNPENWDGGVVPGAGGIVIINDASLANQPRVNVAQNVAETRISAGTLTLAQDFTSDVILTGSGNLTIEEFRTLTGNVTMSSSGTLTVDWNLFGDLLVTDGTTILGNRMTGSTVVSGGDLVLTQSVSFDNRETFTMTGGTVTVAGPNIGVSAVTVFGLSGTGGRFDIASNRILWLSQTSEQTFAGNITANPNFGSAYLFVTGTEALTLSGIDETTNLGGRVTLLAGHLRLAGGQAIADGTVLEANLGSTVALLDSETVAAILADVNSGTIMLNDNTLTLAGVGQAADILFAGTITGTGNLTLDAPDLRQQIAGPQEYTGTTTLTAGILQFETDDVLADQSQLVVNGGTLDMQGFSDTVAAVVLAGGAIAGSGTLTALDDFDLRAGTVQAGLAGDVALVKTTDGVVLQTGENSYTGMTSVLEGVLFVDGSLASERVMLAGNAELILRGADAVSAAAMLDLQDDAILTLGADQTIAALQGGVGTMVDLQGHRLTLASDLATEFAGILTGSGDLHLQDGYDLTLTGAVDLGGSMTISDGRLTLAGDSALMVPDITIGAAGALRSNDARTILGAVTNAGLIDMGNDMAGDILTLAGDYHGNDGLVLLDVVLGDDGSATDRLVVNGSATGRTWVVVNNLGGAGAATAAGIPLIQTAGSTADAFVLAAPLRAGAFDYRLTLDDDQLDWFLTSHLGSGSAAYAHLPLTLGWAVNRLDGYEARIAGRDLATMDQPRSWARILGDRRQTATSTTGSASLTDLQSRSSGIEAGIDLPAIITAHGTWVLGLAMAVTDMNARFAVDGGRARINGTGLSLTGGASWYGAGGTYVDLQGRFSRITADLRANDSDLAMGQRLTGQAASVEIGQAVALVPGGSLVPHLQLSHARLSGDAFTDSTGLLVDPGTENRTSARLGLTWRQALQAGGNVFATGSLERDFDPVTHIRVGDDDVSTKVAADWASLSLGAQMPLATGLQGFANVSYAAPLDAAGRNRAIAAQAGLTLRW